MGPRLRVEQPAEHDTAGAPALLVWGRAVGSTWLAEMAEHARAGRRQVDTHTHTHTHTHLTLTHAVCAADRSTEGTSSSGWSMRCSARLPQPHRAGERATAHTALLAGCTTSRCPLRRSIQTGTGCAARGGGTPQTDTEVFCWHSHTRSLLRTAWQVGGRRA